MVDFASGTVTYNDPVVSTVQAYVEKQRANLRFEHNLILNSLFGARDKSASVPGEAPRLPVRGPGVQRRHARELWMPISTGISTNTTAFRGGQTLPVNVDDVGTRQKAVYAYYYDAAFIFKTEAWENMGPEAVLNIMEDRTEQALDSMCDKIETDLHSANTDTTPGSQEEVMGLQHLIDPTPTTGTAWDLSRTTFTMHRNQVQTVSDTFANVGMNAMRTLDLDVRGESNADGPDLWLTTDILWNAYGKEVEDRHMVTSVAGQSELSPGSLVFRGKPVINSGNAATGTMRSLNLRYFRLFMPPGVDFMVEQATKPLDQALHAGVQWYTGIQWGVTQHRRQGVITGLTDS